MKALGPVEILLVLMFLVIMLTVIAVGVAALVVIKRRPR